MTDCDDHSVDRVIPDLGPGADGDLFDEDTSILVVDRADPRAHPLTARGDHDVHTAVLRGLAAYVARLDHAIAGRRVMLSSVVVHFADQNHGPRRSPSGVVTAAGIGRYSTTSGMGSGRPTIVGNRTAHAALRTTVLSDAIYELDDIEVTVMCEDDVQRSGVRRMLEDGFSPVEWMAGFRLILPPYHNAVAEFLCTQGQQADAPDLAMQSIRPLTMRLQARCPVYRVHELPLAHPSATGTIGIGKRRI